MILYARLLAVVGLLLVANCGGGGSGGQVIVTTPPPPASGAASDITLMFMGNSHTAVNNLSGMVGAMVRAGKPGKSISVTEAPGWMHLEERALDAASLALLQGQRWSAVILQAQNYSLSGQFFYPTTGAEQLVRLTRRAGALPVLFAEWPRLGIAETQLIYDKYVSIATKEPACVAPIPQAFDLARARFPEIILHDADGNHSAPAGAFLAALVLYVTLTGASPTDLPMLAEINISGDLQEKLKGIAGEAARASAPRMWCPADGPL